MFVEGLLSYWGTRLYERITKPFAKQAFRTPSSFLAIEENMFTKTVYILENVGDTNLEN